MASKINLTFLGTADAIPSEKRNHTSILINYNEENILVDCGEGTQRQFRIAKLNPCKITRILITHWHADHILGLIGLLSTLGLSGYNKKLFIYGPKGTKENLQMMSRFSHFKENYEIEIKEISSGRFFENNEFYIEAEEMSHGIKTLAYSFVLKEQTKIDKKKLSKMKIPKGPWLQDIKNGKDVIVNGKKIKSKDLIYRQEGKKISFVFDTLFNDRIVKFTKDSDLLISESTFSSEMEIQAKEKMHLTSKQAGEIAKKSKSKKLILTHLSQRYESNPKIILDEAKKVFKNVSIARDFDKVVV